MDEAVARARAVVGLYGDPSVSWSIGLDVSFSTPYDVERLADRAADVCRELPGLGRPPVPLLWTADPADALGAVLDRPYGAGDPLVRLVTDPDSRRLVLAAHHGAVDGLGLLALLGRLVGDPATAGSVVSNARGIGDRPPATGFSRSSVRRLAEAGLAPPTRLALPDLTGRAGDRSVTGDVTARRDLEHLPVPVPVSTAAAVTATAQAVAGWNRAHGERASRLVAAVGASRRPGSDARPDRDTAYLRLHLGPAERRVDSADALSRVAPEPAFPERRPTRLTRLVTSALRSRLGSTFLVSNLGRVRVPPGMERIAFYPSATGPRGLAVGICSTPGATSVTVRLPRRDFDSGAAEQLCGLIAAGLAGPAGPEPLGQ